MNIDTQTKINAGAGAILGTAVPLLIMAKKRKVTNLLKMNYTAKDMVVLSSSSIVMGTSAGAIGQTKETKKQKLNEGVFQLLNANIPTLAVAGGLKLCSSFKKTNNAVGKLIATSVGLIGGMFGTAELSNKIIDPKDKEPDRKIKMKDAIANIDDLIGALTLAKCPFISNLHIDKVLPAIFTYCGYKAGTNEHYHRKHKNTQTTSNFIS